MLMNDTVVAAGIPFELYSQNHVMTQRYTNRQLIDDIAGEDVPADASSNDVVCVSDLPLPVRVIRPGMSWPQGLTLPSDTLVFVVDHDSIITLVGCTEGQGKLV